MGFPVLDALWVIFKRIMRGKSPLKGDFSHFHHRLLEAGMSQRSALLFNYFLCAVFATIALTLGSAYSKFIAFIGVLGLLAIIGIIMIFWKKRV